MSLNMYLDEVQSQTQSMNAVCIATIQGMEQVIQSIDTFAIDTVLQGQTYSSAKSYFVQTFRPLAQGIIYLCEELIRQNNAFPSQFQAQVASTDTIEQEILEQIREIDRMKASTEAINQTMPMPSMDAMVNLFTVMRRKLQEKLEHLHEFNYTSSSNYDNALQLAASIARGVVEVQSGKGFSPASGTFSTQGLNMEWAASIQAITEERARQADNLLNSSSIEEGAMYGKAPEKYTLDKIWDGILDGTGQAVSDTIDGIKALGDWETWENIGNAVLHPIDTLSTMYNVLSDSFINDVINGDAESRAKWGSYALTQIALGLIGDKGISKVTTLAKGAKFSQGMSRATQLFNKGDNFSLAGGSNMRFGLDNPALRQVEETLPTYQLAKGGVSQPVTSVGEAQVKRFLEKTGGTVAEIKPRYTREQIEHLAESNFETRIDSVLRDVNISREKFDELKTKMYHELNPEEVVAMKQLRDSVPAPTSTTMMQKAIPLEDIKKYLIDERFNEVGGCVAKFEDVADIQSSHDLFHSLRLDYHKTKFTTESDFGVIRFTTDDAENVIIPYGNNFNDPINKKPSDYLQYPQTGNGFVMSENGRIIPEYESPFPQKLRPHDGAEIYEVVNGKERLVGIYSKLDKKFIPAVAKD